MKKLCQKGFGAVEGVLILVIVGIIGGAGFYVYKSKQETNKSQDNANKSSQEISTNESSETPAEQPPAEKFYEVRELGVKFKMSAEMEGMYHHLSVDSQKVVKFSYESFKGTDCAADQTFPVSLHKMTEADMAGYPGGKDIMMPKSKKIGDHYYIALGSQGACSDVAATQAKSDALKQAVVKAVNESLQAL